MSTQSASLYRAILTLYLTIDLLLCHTSAIRDVLLIMYICMASAVVQHTIWHTPALRRMLCLCTSITGGVVQFEIINEDLCVPLA